MNFPVLNTDSVMSRQEWSEAAGFHADEVGRLVDGYLAKKSNQRSEPVIDFLFTYYSFRPAWLKRWSPGHSVLLKDAAGNDHFRHRDFTHSGNDLFLDPTQFPDKRLNALNWTVSLLEAVDKRPPFFGCTGLHEWAMVYKAGEVRHERWPLRVSDEVLEHTLTSLPVQCSHFDAFRFFTDEARPLNLMQPSRDTMLQNEQPGCLHTNMDLYKWAFKLYPWVSGELLLETFLLAREARIMDMKASPYDLAELGYEPIPIETETGRVEYKKQQALIWKKASVLRKRLLSYLVELQHAVNYNQPITI